MPVLLGTGRGPKARQAGSRAYATLDPMRWASSSTLAHLIHNVTQSALVPGICVPVPLGNRLNEIRYTFFVTHVYQATGADCLVIALNEKMASSGSSTTTSKGCPSRRPMAVTTRASSRSLPNGSPRAEMPG